MVVSSTGVDPSVVFLSRPEGTRREPPPVPWSRGRLVASGLLGSNHVLLLGHEVKRPYFLSVGTKEWTYVSTSGTLSYIESVVLLSDPRTLGLGPRNIGTMPHLSCKTIGTRTPPRTRQSRGRDSPTLVFGRRRDTLLWVVGIHWTRSGPGTPPKRTVNFFFSLG